MGQRRVGKRLNRKKGITCTKGMRSWQNRGISFRVGQSLLGGDREFNSRLVKRGGGGFSIREVNWECDVDFKYKQVIG